jgi:hypothetical protein
MTSAPLSVVKITIVSAGCSYASAVKLLSDSPVPSGLATFARPGAIAPPYAIFIAAWVGRRPMPTAENSGSV